MLLFRKTNYKNPTGWGGRGNLGFPTSRVEIGFWNFR